MYKAKLLEIPDLDGDNEILKNATIAMPLNYLKKILKKRSLEMPLSNCKIELKLKWKSYCVLPAADADNINNNDDNIFSVGAKQNDMFLL